MLFFHIEAWTFACESSHVLYLYIIIIIYIYKYKTCEVSRKRENFSFKYVIIAKCVGGKFTLKNSAFLDSLC